MRTKSAFLAGLILLTSGCAAVSNITKPPSHGTGVVRLGPEHRHAPISLSGDSLTGERVATSSFTGIVVINAWASWCRTCIFEWKALQDVAASHPEVAFVGLNESDSKQAAIKFVTAHPSKYPHLFDPHNAILNSIKELPSLSIPTTLVLDRHHRIAARIMGRVTAQDLSDILSDLQSEVGS